MNKIAMSSFQLLLLIVIPFICVLGAASSLDTYETQGTVSEVDEVGDLLVINGVTPAGNSEQMRFKVPDDTKIYQGTEDVHLDDIDVGDPVTVTYYKDSDGTLTTKQIVDNNLGNNQM